MSLLDEFAKIKARETVVDSWIALKESWIAVFEALKKREVDWLEAQQFVGTIAATMPNYEGALMVWAAQVYDKTYTLEDWDDDL